MISNDIVTLKRLIFHFVTPRLSVVKSSQSLLFMLVVIMNDVVWINLSLMAV